MRIDLKCYQSLVRDSVWGSADDVRLIGGEEVRLVSTTTLVEGARAKASIASSPTYNLFLCEWHHIVEGKW